MIEFERSYITVNRETNNWYCPFCGGILEAKAMPGTNIPIHNNGWKYSMTMRVECKNQHMFVITKHPDHEYSNLKQILCDNDIDMNDLRNEIRSWDAKYADNFPSMEFDKMVRFFSDGIRGFEE